MAQTQEQWFHKICTFLPSWWVDKGPSSTRSPTQTPYVEAVLQALAKIASEMEAEIYSQMAQTYIDYAVAAVLDLHASERSIDRLTGETDASLRPRIKTFGATYTNTALSDALTSILDGTYATFALHELEGDGPWLRSEETFLGDTWVSSEKKLYNRALVELLPVKTVIDTNTTIGAGDELATPWVVVQEGVTLTVQGTLSASFVTGPGAVVNSGGTIQTYAAYDAYVAANKSTIYDQIEGFITNNKALGVFIAVQSYLESGL